MSPNKNQPTLIRNKLTYPQLKLVYSLCLWTPISRFLLNTILFHFPRKVYLNLYDFIEPYQYHCYRLSGDINSLLQQRMDFPLTNPCMGGLRLEIGSDILDNFESPTMAHCFPLEAPIKSWIIIILRTKYQIIQATWQKNGPSPMAFS